MAQIVPEFGLSLAVAAVRTAISACPSWQSWTRASLKPAGERMAAAARRVHLFALPGAERPEEGFTAEELDRLRPACGLTLMPPAALRTGNPSFQLMRSATETFVDRARVYVHVVETVEPAITHDDAAVLLAFCNRLGALIYELPTTHEVEGAAFIQGIELVIEPHRASEVMKGTQGDFVQAMLRVSTGLDE